MDQFICSDSYIPLRKGPSHRAEMVSQILFGERFTITDSAANWLKVETLFDEYSGWIDSFHGGYAGWKNAMQGIITGQMLTCMREDGSLMTLFPGSELFGLTNDLTVFNIGQQKYHLKGTQASHFTPHSSVMETAMQFLNAPYLWGGRTPVGTDCSGLLQSVFKVHGMALPRDTRIQATRGTTINFFSEAEPGDMLFFSGENEEISHTGILLDRQTVIHASGRVRADRIDHQGIWRKETGKYTHMLRLIKRMQ
jgi:hypothetical protein